MIVVVIVVVAAALSWLLVMLLGAGQVSSDAKARELAVAEADSLLDEQFAGAPHVTAKLGPRTLPFDQVVVGAEQRGYDLTAQTTEPAGPQTLVFTKRSAPA